MLFRSNDTATTEIYTRKDTLSLHDALPIYTGTVTVAALRHQPPGSARIAGLLLSRQRPPTAHGTVFLAIEDETGIANVTIRNNDWPRMRDAVRGASLLLIEGRLERTGQVANLVAERIAPLTAGRLGRKERVG